MNLIIISLYFGSWGGLGRILYTVVQSGLLLLLLP